MAKQIATKVMAMTTMMALALVLLTATTGVHAANSECCSTCIGKASSAIYDYDPLVFDQCSLSGSKRVCCFCTNLGEPLYGDTISYAEDGTTPTAKTGTWIKFKWTDAVNVTYISLKDGQKKTTTPTISDTTATLKSGYFMICANSVGKVIFRGWGDNACRVASVEKSVTVVQGESGATCEAEPPAPTTTTAPSSSSSSATGSGSADTGISDCNTSRATIKTVNGVKQCVCVSDWAGAPACDQMPTWKWLVTIGGGVAALLSILISVRAFMKSREKKRLDEENVSTPRLGSRKDDVEILQITPDRRSHEMPVVAAPYQGSSRDVTSAQPVPYGRENNRAQSNPRRNDEREFTL